MDKVFVDALEIECTIGIHDWERRITQPVVLDIEIGFDNRRAGASDDIADALDYAGVIALARSLPRSETFLLLERFAERLCQRILATYPASSVQVTARKRIPSLGAAAVGVVVFRERGDG